MKRKEQEINQNLKLIAKSSLIVFIGIFIAKVLNYAYRIIIARIMGPETFGLFVISITVIGLITSLLSIGFPEGLVRYIAVLRGKKQHNKIRNLFRFSIALTFFAGVIGGISLFILSRPIAVEIFHNSSLTNFLIAFAIAVPIILIYNIFSALLRAFEEISWYSFIENILQNFMKLASLIFLIFLGLKINAVIFSYLIGISITLFVSYLVLINKIPHLFKKENIKTKEKSKVLKGFIQYSLPLMFFGIVSSFLVLIDSFVIGYFKDASQVGFQNAAISIALLLLTTPLLFSKLFLPLITKEYGRKNFKLIEELSRQVQKWIFIINLPALLLMLLFPGAIINILFGSTYLVAENALRFMALGLFILSIGNSVAENLIYMMGKSKLVLYNIIFVSIVHLVLNIILVPKYGINGSAFSTMIVCMLLSLMTFIQVRHYISIKLLGRKTLRIISISLIPTIILFFITKLFIINNLILILSGTFFILSYIFLIVIVGCLDKNDFSILKSIKKKTYSLISPLINFGFKSN